MDENDDVMAIAAELSKDPDVEFAQPNYIYHPSYVPIDPDYSIQWALKNTETLVDINAEKAWDITRGSSSVIVGVLDTGIDINHPDLINNIYVNPGEIPENGEDDDHNGYPDDVSGYDFYHDDRTVFDSAVKDFHGTHVAGIIAASSNSIGITGIAPNVKILPLKFGENQMPTSDAIEAIEYAKKMGASIINCSWGNNPGQYIYNDPALFRAMTESGMLFVLAAGNERVDIVKEEIAPAYFEHENILTVSAMDCNGNLANFSNYGSAVDVAAPGVDIHSTLPGGSYDLMSGTSMAAPYVAGVAALVKSMNPSMTASSIAQKIKNSAITNSAIKGKIPGGLVVDAYEAVKNTPMLNIKKTICTENEIYLEWDPVAGASGYQVTVGNGTPQNTNLTNFTLTGLISEKNYVIKVSARNSSGVIIAEKRAIGRTLQPDRGVGMTGEYYNDLDLNDLEISRIENVDFYWGNGSPDSSINNSSFTVLWKGELESRYSEEYTIYAQTQGATKLWIDGKLIFDRTVDDTNTIQEISGNIELIANKCYPIQLEYYESYGAASIKLLWSSESQRKEVIPSSRLWPLSGTCSSWTQGTPSFREIEFGRTDAVVESGNLYALISEWTDPRIEVYDENLNQFVKIADFPSGLKLIEGAASLNGKIYLFEEKDSNINIYEYDISSGQWNRKNTKNDFNNIRPITVNGNIYIFGGGTNGGVYIYNPVTDTWSLVSQMPDNRSKFALAELNGIIYMTGGYLNGYLNTVYGYDINNNTWTQKSDMITRRAYHGSFAFNGRIFAIGGTCPQNLSEVEQYDPVSDTWFVGEELLSTRYLMGAACFKGKGYAIYGATTDFDSYSYFDILSPKYAVTYKISGYIKPDLESPDPQIRSGFKVSINGLEVYTAYTNQDGYFEIQGVPPNAEGYTIKISKEQYLYREIKNVKVKTRDVQIGSQVAPVDMWAGDITNDNVINTLDQIQIALHNNTIQGDPNFDPACDLNKDGSINMFDTFIISKHYGATPESYPDLF